MAIQILVVCRHPDILQTIMRLVTQHPGWHAEGALADEQAMELFERQAFDIVLLGSGLDDASEGLLRQSFTQQRPEIIIIQHFGGGSGLLGSEIMAALDKR